MPAPPRRWSRWIWGSRALVERLRGPRAGGWRPLRGRRPGTDPRRGRRRGAEAAATPSARVIGSMPCSRVSVWPAPAGAANSRLPSSKVHARAIRRGPIAPRGSIRTSVGLIEGLASGVAAVNRAELRMPCGRVLPPPTSGPLRSWAASLRRLVTLMSDAAMAGLIKTALALHHRILPPAGGADRLDRKIAGSGFERLSAARPWIHGDSQNPRRAGVNAFGLAGMTLMPCSKSIPPRPTG